MTQERKAKGGSKSTPRTPSLGQGLDPPLFPSNKRVLEITWKALGLTSSVFKKFTFCCCISFFLFLQILWNVKPLATTLHITPFYHRQHCNNYTAESPEKACQVSCWYQLSGCLPQYGFHLCVFIQASQISPRIIYVSLSLPTRI